MAAKQNTANKQNSSMPWRWLGISLIVICLDQLTKIAIVRNYYYGISHSITSFFNLTLVYNRGAAFSFLASQNGWQRWALTGFGIAAALFLTYLLTRHRTQRLFCTALSLILGGALGNVIDRLLYGHVVDFLDFHIQRWHWPPFNIADTAITCGAFLLIYDELRRVRGSK